MLERLFIIIAGTLVISCSHSNDSMNMSKKVTSKTSVCSFAEESSLDEGQRFVTQGWIREGLPEFRSADCPESFFLTLPSQINSASRLKMQTAMNESMRIMQGGVYGDFELEVIFNSKTESYNVRLLDYSSLKPMGLSEFLAQK